MLIRNRSLAVWARPLAFQRKRPATASRHLLLTQLSEDVFDQGQWYVLKVSATIDHIDRHRSNGHLIEIVTIIQGVSKRLLDHDKQFRMLILE